MNTTWITSLPPTRQACHTLNKDHVWLYSSPEKRVCEVCQISQHLTPMSKCCTCGHQWPAGTNGSHSCASVLEQRIIALEALRPNITLNRYQLQQALSLIAEDDPNTEIVINQRPHWVSEEGEDMPAGLYASYEEYPEEGLFPLPPN
jgi:hypothetical protein